MRVWDIWDIGSGTVSTLRRRWTPIRSKRSPGSPLIGPLAPPVGACHPQQAGTAPGDDGRGMSLAMRTRLYAARAILRPQAVAGHAAVTQLPPAPDGLQPAEHLLNPLPHPLTRRVPRMTARPAGPGLSAVAS